MRLHSQLRARLEPLARRQRHFQLWCKLAGAWAIAAMVAVSLIGLQKAVGWSSTLSLPIGLFAGLLMAARVLVRTRWREPDWRSLALQIEAAHPELRGSLLTAVQQETAENRGFDYLQQRVIQDALAGDRRKGWDALFPRSRVFAAQAAQFGTLAIFVLVLSQLRVSPGDGVFVPAHEMGVAVSPGDVSIERGSSLVVAARFSGRLPPRVELIVTQSAVTNHRIPLIKSLGDPLFGGTVPEVSTNLLYHLEFGGKRTRDYRVTVFDYPRLERADADITFPAYTRLSPRHTENTKRVSAVEGSRLELRLQLNKPVALAQFISRDTNRTVVGLALETERPAAALRDFPIAATRTYELQLVDAEGRTNRLPAQFVIEALQNRPPELKVASPRGDSRPSPLEEVAFEGTVYDDFGVEAFGLASALAGKETKVIELGRSVPGKEKRPFHFLLRLEELGLEPDDLMSWFVWADDIGPDGKVRRTTGDLFFAEVRPFDEIYREGQSMSAEAQQQQQQSGQSGGQAGRLAELEKQIISATWKILRQKSQPSQPAAPKPAPQEDKPSSNPSNRSSSLRRSDRSFASGDHSLPSLSIFIAQRDSADPGATDRQRPIQRRPQRQPDLASDLEVVLSAQEQALEQAEAGRENQQDPRTSDLWEAVARQMESALSKLRSATRSPAAFQEALAAEQAAYQALLKLQEREYSVTRNRGRQSGQNSRQQQMQRQLDQLDLSRDQDRYETERQARAPQSAERNEQLQVMNRLQELARRQQDLNERLQELQTALQEARSENEREEIRRQLKRLQEEEQELLADADEVRQRMERPENQSRMVEQRQQMQQARNDLQRAAEAARQGEVSQALASGTRAQRQLQQMREDMRRENAGEFEQDLRQMRTDARELARRQEEIQEKMSALNDPTRRNLTDAELNQQTLQELAEQRGRLTNLVENATQLSRQAEDAEPLMARELYDTLRKFSQDETSTAKQFQEEFLNRSITTRELYERLKQTSESSGAKSLDLTSEMLRRGLMDDANIAQERARAGIENLKRGIERAAQGVLGDDTQSLRLAGEELNRLADQLQREISQAEGGGTNRPQEIARATNQPQPGAEDGRRGGQEGQPSEAPGGEPRRADSPGQRAQAQSPQPRTGGGQPGENSDNPQRQDGSPNEANRDGQNPARDRQRGANRLQSTANSGGGGGNPFAFDLDRLLDGRGGYDGGPITGEDFAPWSDRLREVEELVELPSLRNDVARARERARQVRQDFKRTQKKPDWATVRLQVLKPLVEVRSAIEEELARREPRDNLVPIDRDPVPGRYLELVRRYYEHLGRDSQPTGSRPAGPQN